MSFLSFISFFLLPIGISCLFIGCYSLIQTLKIKKTHIQSIGTIIEIREKKIKSKNSSTKISYLPLIAIEIEGEIKEIEGEPTLKSNYYQIGQELEVYYNPKKAEEIAVFQPKIVINYSIIIATGIVFILISVWFFFE